MRFENMSHDDVNLRLGGTFVPVVLQEERRVVFVQEILCRNSPSDSGYWDATPRLMRVLYKHKDGALLEADVAESVQDVLFAPPNAGYACLKGRWWWCAQVPERQTKAGAPPHSIRLTDEHGARYRLSDFHTKDALVVLEQLYFPQPATTQDWSLRAGLLLGSGRVYGPEFFLLGTYKKDGTSTKVRTAHPETLSHVCRAAGVSYARS